MTPDIPVPTEADYLEAARAFSETARLTGGFLVPTVEESAALYAANRKFRAAVDSAYAAGWRAHIKLYSDSNNALRAGHWPDDGCACYFCRLARGEVPSGFSQSGNPASTERGTP